MADKRMVDDLDNLQASSYQPGLTGIYNRIMSNVARGVMDAKYKLGLGISMREVYKRLRHSKKFTKKTLENELFKNAIILQNK